MKNSMRLLLAATLGLLSFLPANNNLFDNQDFMAKKSGLNAPSPIDGSWELYSTEIAGRTTFHKKPKQFNMKQKQIGERKLAKEIQENRIPKKNLKRTQGHK